MSVVELQELDEVKGLLAKGQQVGVLSYAEITKAMSELDLDESDRQRLFVELHDRIRELATGKAIALKSPSPMNEREERPSAGKRFSLGAAITAAGTIVTIVVVFLGWRSMNFTDAVEKFESGSLAAIPELAAHGDKGILVLVDGLDATGESKPALFPKRSLQIIKALRQDPDAVESHRVALHTEAAENRRKIEGIATTLEVQLEKDVAVSGEQVEQLENLARVAVCLNQLLRSEPADWPELAIRVRVLLRELPTCESRQ